MEQDLVTKAVQQSQQGKWTTWEEVIESGARGVVGRSTYAFLTKIGLSSRERTKVMTRMSGAAEAASFLIWKMRSQKKSSKATAGVNDPRKRRVQLLGREMRNCREIWAGR